MRYGKKFLCVHIQLTFESSIKAVDFSDAGKYPLLGFHIVLQADLGVLEPRVAVVIPPVELHHLFVLKVHYATEMHDEITLLHVEFPAK